MLELHDLRRRFGPVVALDGMTFSVPPGTVFGFLGPNGSGKTTAMRAVLGVTALDGGEIRFRSTLVDAPMRRRFGYMPEERGLYPGMRVLEQLRYFGELHGMQVSAAEQASRALCERLGLAGRLESKVEELSLGNQQRVQLAAALVHEPELLVLDEPFSGLDPIGIDELAAVLRDRARAGTTLVFSSHQLDLVEHLCEQVAIVDRGRLVAGGTVRGLERGGTPRVEIRVAGDVVGGWATRATLPPGVGVESVDPRDGTVLLRLPDAASRDERLLGRAGEALLEAARTAGPIEHFARARRSLSEVFRETVGRPAEVPADSPDVAEVAP